MPPNSSSSSSSSGSSPLKNLLHILPNPCLTLTQFRKFKKTIYFKLLILIPLAWISFLLLVSAFGGGGGGGGRNSNNHEDLSELIPEHQKSVSISDQNHVVKSISSHNSNNNLNSHNNNNNEVYGGEGDAGVLAPPGELKPGEMGKAYRLSKNITEEQKKVVGEGWKKNAFNQFVSDLISVRRSLPDPRDEWCKSRSTSKLLPESELPQTSVIICFHNEAWSVLLRSVHSVLDRSPPELLREIILVDDFSDMDHVKHQLESYMVSYPKVKIVRAKKREGLIRARLMGAAVAKGPVLTFLDSHIEATAGWLEPLLDRIARDPTTVVCPVIDVIDDDTLEYHYSDSKATSVGGFDWNLQFTWHAIPEKERSRHTNSAEPVRSPTMAGGLFSIDKDFFEKLGTYDSGFDIWGGENLELSFKTWMCGGTLEIVPCSHVGHIFRKRSPYKWRTGVNVLRRNSVRLAKVWMDDYAEYYYQRIGHDVGDFGDIASRLKLRSELNCKDFKWFLTNIYPELFIPGEALAHGEIRNLGLGGTTCLDSPATKKHINKPLGLYPCHGQGGNQYWSYSKTGEIRRDEMCVDYAGQDVMIYPCHGSMGNQHWVYDHSTGQIRHGPSHKCLSILTREKLQMEHCDSEKETQLWRFQNFNSTAAKAILPHD